MVHIMYLVGFRSKMMVMMGWIWNYLVHERGARTITADPEVNIKRVPGLNRFEV